MVAIVLGSPVFLTYHHAFWSLSFSLGVDMVQRSFSVGASVTIATGVALLIIGTYLSYLPEKMMGILGALLVGLGTALLSLNQDETRRLDRAKETLKPHLEPICDQFLFAIRNLRLSNRDFRDGVLSSDAAYELFGAHTASLEESLRNLHAYGGTQTDPTRFKRRMDQTRVEDPGDSTVVATRPIVETHANMRPIDWTQDRHLKGEETVECPTCRTPNMVLLGVNLGDSAMTNCTACGTRFHVHRDRHGEAFSKAWGSGVTRQLSADCPSCSNFEFRFPEQAREARFCLACHALIGLSGDLPQVVRASSEPIIASEVGMKVNGKSRLRCSRCEAISEAFTKYNGSLFAVCSNCDQLLKTPESARWN